MPLSLRSPTIALALFAAVCLAGAELGQLIVDRAAPLSLPPLWPPAGVLVGTLVVIDRRRWMPFVLTACATVFLSMTVLHGRAIPATLALSVFFGLDACVAAWLIRRTTADAFALDRLPHTFAFVVSAAIAPIIGGLLAAAMLGGSSPVFSQWRAWWFAEAIGIVVTGPIAIAAITGGPPSLRVRPLKVFEIAIVFAAGIVMAEGIFGARVQPLLQVPAYILPFLLWSVFRFGPVGSSAAGSILAFIVLWHASHGEGPFAPLGGGNVLLRSQGGIASAAASLILLASTVAERKRVAQERDVVVAELQQALAEIKTLRGLIPICAWCHKVRDDAGFWHKLETYLDEKTDATLSHGICPACAERQENAVESKPGN